MAVSDSVNFTQTTQEIIQLAFFHIGKYGMGRLPSVDDYNIAKRILNTMVKSWAAKGLHLWAKEEGILHLTQYVNSYSLGGSTSYFTNLNDQITTKLSVAATGLATSLSVVSTANMAVGDIIGIVLDDKSTHWTTIATIPGATSLTITVGITSAAAINSLVYTFTERAPKPLRILDARLVSGFDATSSSTQVEVPMNSIGYQDYWNLSSTTLSGSVPNQFHYNPKVDNGIIYIWPRPNDTSYRMQLTYERMINDLDTLADTFDFPAEWLDALQWQLALRLAPGFGATSKVPEIATLATAALEYILGWDSEINSVFFQPEQGY